MSNPLAVSILAKLTNWYSFDGDTTDAHGSDDLITGAAVSGYEAGVLGADRVQAGSRHSAALASPIAFANNSGSMTIGGLFDYTAGTPNTPEFGYSYGGISSGDEAFKICTHPDGYFYAITWESTSVGTRVSDPLEGAVNWPVTVEVTDAAAATATSDQLIRIAHPGVLQPGLYFVVANWESGVRTLFMDAVEVASEPPPAAVKAATIPRIEIGRGYSPANTVTALQNCFACAGAALTQTEIAYIFNGGTFRSYADIVADAA